MSKNIFKRTQYKNSHQIVCVNTRTSFGAFEHI